MRRLTLAAGMMLLAICTAPAATTPKRRPVRTNLLLKMTAAFVDGECTVILEKDTRVSADGLVSGTYHADNASLHWCQYEREMADDACHDRGVCPSYEGWSASNPQLNPILPRGVFIAQLEERQHQISVQYGNPRN